MTLKKKNQLLFGVGINDADYKVSLTEKIDGQRKVIWRCPFYVAWRGMLQRCYDKKQSERFPTYVGCTVTNDWLTFSNFKVWMQTQDWQGKELDKDILVISNKLYSPQTCVFVEQRVNMFIVENNANRGDWPIGVSWDSSRKKFVAYCWNVTTKKNKMLGLYISPEEAHRAWLSYKLKQAMVLAGQQQDERVAKALIDRYQNYRYYFE